MGKKGTKRKTRWRAFSITESTQDTHRCPISKANSTIQLNLQNDSTADENLKFLEGNSSYLRRKLSLNYRNNIRSSNSDYFNRSNNNFLSSTSSLHSRYSHKRRQLSSQNGLFKYNYGPRRPTNQIHRTKSEPSDNENIIAKPLFNEDEYTRITTPRQDVIFKKGYFSQPRKYFSSTDTTTSSAAASIVSTEESMSGISVPSFSPEQCSSNSESIDQEQAFMYSYFDQNGVFYVSPYLPTSFDQYGAQMVMLPYGYSPYNNIYSTDNSPINTDPDSANEDKISEKDSTKSSTCSEKDTEKSTNKTDEPENFQNEEIDIAKKEDSSNYDINKENKISPIQNPNNILYNYGHQQFYPPIYCPYVFGHQYVPIMETQFDVGCDVDRNTLQINENSEDCFVPENKPNSCPQHCRSPENISNNKATSDYPKITNENNVPSHNNETDPKIKELTSKPVETTIENHIQSSLNVNVKEFLPRNYKTRERTPINNIKENNTINRVIQLNENKITPSTEITNVQIQNSVITKSRQETSKLIQQKHIVKSNKGIKGTKKDNGNHQQVTRKIKTDSTQTYAEKIKSFKQVNGVIQETKPSIIKNATPKLKKSKDLTEKSVIEDIPIEKIKNGSTSKTYAEMLNNIKSGHTITEKSLNNNRKQIKVTENKTELNSKIQILSNIVENHENSKTDEWLIVKPRGKRNKTIKGDYIENIELETTMTLKTNDEKDKNHFDTKIENNLDIIETINKEILIPTSNEIKNLDSSITENETLSLSTITNLSYPSDKKKETTKSRTKKTKILKSRPKIKNNNNNNNNNNKHESKNELPKKTENQLSYNKIKSFCNNNNNTNELSKTNSSVDDEQDDEISFSPFSNESKSNIMRNIYHHNSLNMLNGFDYKYKGNTILKEDEEMVLNVIKSLQKKNNCEVNETIKNLNENDKQQSYTDIKKTNNFEKNEEESLNHNNNTECKELNNVQNSFNDKNTTEENSNFNQSINENINAIESIKNTNNIINNKYLINQLTNNDENLINEENEIIKEDHIICNEDLINKNNLPTEQVILSDEELCKSDQKDPSFDIILSSSLNELNEENQILNNSNNNYNESINENIISNTNNEYISKINNELEQDLNNINTINLNETINDNNLTDTKKYPLTQAVLEWLNNECKEKTPETILRLPKTKLLNSNINDYNENNDFLSDDTSDTENDNYSKNLKSNPLLVSSVKSNSDDITCKRVANKILNKNNNDLFNYWDDEFIYNPKKWLNHENYNNQNNIENKIENINSISNEQLTPYESLYGKSIDYNQLAASNYEFLSNTIINFNDNNNDQNFNINHKNNISIDKTKESLNDNFDNKQNTIKNCIKPPEVCCVMM